MSPLEHGETFVTDDGAETDLDLGNYERYLGITLTRDNNITTGKIYSHVIEKERRGDYLGRTVQIVPHIVNAIVDWVERAGRVPVDETGQEPDVCIIELGGTVGDIESMPFVEAMTQLRARAGRDNFMQIHVSYVPSVHGEQKTKPTQMAIRTIRSAGLFPDSIAIRAEKPLEPAIIEKISRFCAVSPENCLNVYDLPSTYQVPIHLESQGLVEILKSTLRLGDISIPPAMTSKGAKIWHTWKSLAMERPVDDVEIVMVGKYLSQPDAYLSVEKSLEHSAMKCKRKLRLIRVDAEELEAEMQRKNPANTRGFGQRGCEGMIAAARWAREQKVPYLGICLGMQIAVIEAARSLAGFDNIIGNSEEFDASSDDRIVISMPEHHTGKMGGTMRLGLRPTYFQPGTDWSRLKALYAATAGDANISAINERHRHRYEVNPKYTDVLEKVGFSFIGKDDTSMRNEIIEIREHPWFVGVQYHPEYRSKVLSPSRPFLGFVAASAGVLDEITRELEREAHAEGVNGTTVNGENGKAAF
ncbi:CTP synthase ura7 [Taxawa tesnikishii (nom. ined.)]|nr:CTP synthase ura7 [Dothideales sp. JES 119]